MDSKQGKKQGPRSYFDFEPSFEWSRGQETDILRVHLPGFKREYIKVQVDNHGTLRTTGEHPTEGNHWRRFGKDFRIPKNSKINGIRAKFESETLFITIPKEITQAQSTVQNQLPTEEKPAPTPTKPAPAPTPAPAPPAQTLTKPAPAPTPAPAPPAQTLSKPAPAPTPALAPTPTPAPAPTSAPAPRDKPTKLSDLIGAERENDKIRAKNEEEKLEKKEDKPVQEKIMETQDNPVQEKIMETQDKPVQEKITETQPDKPIEAVKEEIQTGGNVTQLQNPRRMLMLNVVVAILVLVVIGFYMSFKLRRGVADEEHGEEL